MAVRTLTMGALIGILGQSTLYGLYLVLFVGSLYVTYTKQRRGDQKGINAFLFAVTITLFLFITAHWLIQILRIIDAFIFHVDGNPELYYAYPGNPKYVAKTAVYVGQTIIADAAMVYRLYIAWGKSWGMVLLPSILTIGLAGSGIGLTASLCNIPRGQSFFTGKFIGLIATFNGATLILNLVISGLISYRIWIINRNVTGLTGHRRVNPVVYILLEGAALYVGCLVGALVGYMVGGPYQFIPLDAASPMIGIAFCMIIVWVGLGMGAEQQSQVISDIRFRRASASRKNGPPAARVDSATF